MSRPWAFPPSGISAKTAPLQPPMRSRLLRLQALSSVQAKRPSTRRSRPMNGRSSSSPRAMARPASGIGRSHDQAATAIPGTDGAQLPAWKQTGNVISFFAGDRLKQVPRCTDSTIRDLSVATSRLRRIVAARWFTAVCTGRPRRDSSADERHLNDATRLRPGDRSHAFPMVVGSSDAFVYIATLRRRPRVRFGWSRTARRATSERRRATGSSLDTHCCTCVTAFCCPNVSTLRHGSLGRCRARRARCRDNSVRAQLLCRVAAAADRRTAAAAAPAHVVRLGSAAGTPPRDPGDYWQVRLSPDDRYAAVTTSTPLLRTLDVILVPMSETGNIEPVTRALAADSDPVWSPDGTRLVFRSLQDGPPHLFTRAGPRPGCRRRRSSRARTWTKHRPTGEAIRVLAHAPGTAGDFDLWTSSPATGAREKVVEHRLQRDRRTAVA